MASWQGFVHFLLLVILLTSSGHATLSSGQGVVPDTGVVIRFDGERPWKLSSDDGAYTDIPANVPGDVITDLEKAGIIRDPLYSINFLTQRHVWTGEGNRTDSIVQNMQQYSESIHFEERRRSWKYTTTFSVPLTYIDPSSRLLLVAEGIKMGASIEVNGVRLGVANDQFLRYIFEVPTSALSVSTHAANGSVLDATPWRREKNEGGGVFGISNRFEPVWSQNELTVAFDPSITTDGRFMACSGGWDWAPYSRTVDERGSRVLSFGIVRPMYLMYVQKTYVTHVVPKIYYLGEYPREPMFDGPRGDFKVEVNVHLNALYDYNDGGEIAVRSDFTLGEVTVAVGKLDKGLNVVKITLIASRDEVQLWWPAGTGRQHLYNIEVSHRMTEESSNWWKKRVGFRTSALVTTDDTKESFAQTIGEGSGTHGMFFRVNGALIWCRGANFIPMDQFDGLLTDEAHRIAVRSAAAANMNMLRVWGGGMILPDAFYDACDEEGVLLYHDLMFVEEDLHPPKRVPNQDAEIRYIVRELSSHPSIVVWDGCNECSVKMDTSTAIYATFVMDVVAQEDDTRAIWPSCPSGAGWSTGVHTEDSRPNGNPLTTPSCGNEASGPALESHGPYFHGASENYPAVNGGLDKGLYDPATPIVVKESSIGPQFGNHFVSEFGASVFSSFESMSAYLDNDHWSVHGGSSPDVCTHWEGNMNNCSGQNVMAERNYPCDNHIEVFFGDYDLSEVGAGPFQQQLYHCMMGQALKMKATIESHRSMNSFGTLVWQLNENWPTGGWGSIEYGSTTGQAGQIVGGRWKPLMHMMRAFLFRDVIATCGSGGKCFCRNDGVFDVNVTVNIDAWDVALGTVIEVLRKKISFVGGKGQTEWFEINNTWDIERTILVLTVTDLDGSLQMEKNVVLLSTPKELTLLPSNAEVQVLDVKPDGNGNADVVVTSNAVALYIVLTSAAQGRFEENAFPLMKGERKVVKFVPMDTSCDSVDIDQLQSTLRVEHMGMYSVRPSKNRRKQNMFDFRYFLHSYW